MGSSIVIDDFSNPAAIAAAQAEQAQTDRERDYRQRQQARDARSVLAIAIIRRVRDRRLAGVNMRDETNLPLLAAADREAQQALARCGLTWDDVDFQPV
jgi:hypothetical protein